MNIIIKNKEKGLLECQLKSIHKINEISIANNSIYLII